jgi:flagellar biosynthesis protein FlhF
MMRVDRHIEFEADNDAEAVRIARERLGREAVILSTRMVKRGGFLGMFRRRALLVSAGVLEPDPGEEQRENRDRVAAFQQMLEARRAVSTPLYAPAYPPMGLVEGPLAPPLSPSPSRRPVAVAVRAEAAPERSAADGIGAEVAELRAMLASVLERIDGPAEESGGDPEEERLLRNEVDPRIARALVEEYRRKPSVPFRDHLASKIPVSASDPFRALGGRCVMFVGPTGVGKTTSIAKLAAIHSLWEGKRVALITADTYRIAAVEQLRTYAKILGIPMEVVFQPEEIDGALRRHAEADLILLDTAGRSHRDQRRMDELKLLHERFRPDAVHLVIASNIKYRDMLDVIDRMGVVPLHSLLFTKVDETATFGPLLNAVLDFRLPVSFLTVGQGVPNDIEVARSDRIAGLVLEGDGRGGR